MDKQVKLSGVVKESIVDGKGIRYVIFTQGCPHNCEGCHNPDTHDFAKGYFESTQVLFEQIKSNPLLKGITLSGGEPFCQAEALLDLVKKVKAIGKDVWAYSGYTYEQLQQQPQPFAKELLNEVDVLVDGKFVLSQRDLTLLFRGSKNQRLIDCNKTRAANDIVLFS
ncbi:anaerobic ribonucleoside-triphosphate reductase activating protein [Paludicola sp. MB14-C6]|uniref:anaerobic ribonucleoside-triphosphate reductase activating protein n=1 Tax=Paludihabitans sp. MB14-C6 TaxID=3070656 RepID=UPI0027DB392B|nr:anaerobic ribonucleoside-triphosphate reductase activating protein [Paludicola sp. MB14-C6]WMJ23233.1 anaerobic ribonucleoside-triphosphate reductase activating protein [Paludicola sp. MB14-C6]